MGWRDFIVTSQPHQATPEPPTKGSFGDFGDFGPQYENKSSLSINSIPGISIPTDSSPISPKLTTHSPDDLDDRVVVDDPVAPLEPGWLVVYRDRTYRLRGGCDERDHGTVAKMEWGPGSWTVWLTNGEALPLSRVRSVASTNADGQVVNAWDVRGCGVSGHGRPGLR